MSKSASATQIDICGRKGCGMVVTSTDPDRTIVRGLVFHGCCVAPDYEAESIATMFKALHNVSSFLHHEDKVKLAMAETHLDGLNLSNKEIQVLRTLRVQLDKMLDSRDF